MFWSPPPPDPHLFVLSPEILLVDNAIFVLHDFVYLLCALNFPRSIYDTTGFIFLIRLKRRPL